MAPADGRFKYVLDSASVRQSGNASDIGTTIIATPQNEPGFIQFSQFLTDGKAHLLVLPLTPPSSYGGQSECGWFHNDGFCRTGVDLAGSVIERITYTQKAWYYDIPGRNPNGDGRWYDTYSAYRLTIEGYRVPEPNAIALFAIGALVVASARARRRGQHESRR